MSFTASRVTANQRFSELTKCFEQRTHLEHLREMRHLDLQECQLKLDEERKRLQQAQQAQRNAQQDQYSNGAVYIEGAHVCRDVPPPMNGNHDRKAK